MTKVSSSLEMVNSPEGGSQKVFRCRCGKVICGGDENYKEHVLMREGPLRDAGPPAIFSGEYRGQERFVFRQFFCPQCLTLLECEVSPKGSELIWDFRPL